MTRRGRCNRGSWAGNRGSGEAGTSEDGVTGGGGDAASGAGVWWLGQGGVLVQ